MKTETLYPQIIMDTVIRDFPNRLFSMSWTNKNTVMVWNRNITLYYVMNEDNTAIVDIQVD
jgi:Zn-dependent oligopeptidase